MLAFKKIPHIYVFLLVLTGLFLPSVLLYALPISQMLIAFILILILFFLWLQSNRLLNVYLIILIFIGLSLSVLTALYWLRPFVLFYLGYFALACLVIGMAREFEIKQFVELSTQILIVMTLGAWISFFYAFTGGSPLFEINDYPGQPVSWYLTSFALSIHGQGLGTFIRPSGLFDEPGALAFFISTCAASRMILGLNSRKTWFLLIISIITTSVTMFLVIAVLFLFEVFRSRAGIVKSIFSTFAILIYLLITVLILLFFEEFKILFEVAFTRFLPGEDGRLIQGDSRTVSFLNAFQQMNFQRILFGYDESCFGDVERCYSLDIEGGGTPLQPMMMRGLLSQFIYYFVMIVFLFRVFFSKFRLVYFAIFLVFAQRPYILAIGYSVWAVLFLWIPYMPSRQKILPIS